MFPSYIISWSFEIRTLMSYFLWVFQVKFLFTRIDYHNLIKIAHAFPYYGRTMLECMTCMEYYYSKVVRSFYDLHVTINFYGTFYDFNVFIDRYDTRMREILSYTHTPEITSMCYMYETN